MTKQQKENLEKAVTILENNMVPDKEAVRSFDRAWLETFQIENQDVPQRYLIHHLQTAQLTGADPRLKEIHLLKFYDKELGHKVGTTVFSIHFMRKKAKDAATKEGHRLAINVESAMEPVLNPFKKETKEELVSTATAIIDGNNYKFKARWGEFGNTKSIWRGKPVTMLEKCAEAGLLRRLYPDYLGNVYEAGEINNDAKEVEIKQMESDIVDPVDTPLELDIKKTNEKK